MHSHWGLNFSIVKETGYTLHYLMWGISWVNLQLMLADAPSYKINGKKEPTAETEADFNKFLDL